MMKKIITLLMISFMLLTTLTGCGGGSGDHAGNTKPDDGDIQFLHGWFSFCFVLLCKTELARLHAHYQVA